MIDIYAKQINNTWYGIACIGRKIAATAVGSDRQGAVNSLLKSLPEKVEIHSNDEFSTFAEETILALEKLHKGIQAPVSFALASEYLTELRAKVLEIAAHIPVGYVASYGDIAKLAGTDARAVGQFMATNPLYPVVPCHRVIGADFSLVGYGGGKKPSALRAKLARLIAECKGFKSSKNIAISAAILKVHPVERVVEKARRQGLIMSLPSQSHLTIY